MDLSKMSDIELAKFQGQLYAQLMQTQANLMLVSKEIESRDKKGKSNESTPESK